MQGNVPVNGPSHDTKGAPMFKPIALIASVVATAALFSGCDENRASKQADSAREQAQKDADALKDSAAAAANDAGGEAQKQADRAAERASDIASDASKAVTEQAQELYRKAEQMINESRWPEAQSLVDQLEALKDRLPAEWQSRVDQIRTALKNARPN